MKQPIMRVVTRYISCVKRYEPQEKSQQYKQLKFITAYTDTDTDTDKDLF